jgi:hypothetical protein
MVATVLKSPLATRSISSSICCSVDEGELRMVYVEWGIAVGTGWDPEAVEVGRGGGGRREKRDGEGAMKDKYWSRTYLKRRKDQTMTNGM